MLQTPPEAPSFTGRRVMIPSFVGRRIMIPSFIGRRVMIPHILPSGRRHALFR